MKQIILLNFALLLLVLLSCSEQNEIIPEIDVNELGLNTSQNREAILNAVTDVEKIQKVYDERTQPFRYKLTSETKNGFTAEEAKQLLYEYASCSSCPDANKEFLIPLLTQLIDTPNENIKSVLNDFDEKVLNSDLEISNKSDLLFLSFVFDATAEAALNMNETESGKSGASGCSVGKEVALGIAGGFLTGCAAGGIKGALGGSFWPGIGTFTGAVSGCIIVGFEGAIAGGLFGALVGGLDCLFN
ncbi:MAG: hypothetical protein ACJAS3_002926 [Roseivirga sp.]|jgi:hypothetical protein